MHEVGGGLASLGLLLGVEVFDGEANLLLEGHRNHGCQHHHEVGRDAHLTSQGIHQVAETAEAGVKDSTVVCSNIFFRGHVEDGRHSSHAPAPQTD